MARQGLPVPSAPLDQWVRRAPKAPWALKASKVLRALPVQPGIYRISYAVNTTVALLLSTRLVVNGSPVTASTVTPVISLSNYSNEILASLPANSSVQLQLLGISINLTLVNGAGATLMIQRLS